MGIGRQRLGRGLRALIGGEEKTETHDRKESIDDVFVTQLRPNSSNPRANFTEDEICGLAASIKERGIIQPIIVRPIIGEISIFEIIAGERRWRAAKSLGLKKIPAIVRNATNKETLELAIIENVQRADLNPIEEALGYQQLIRSFSHTQEALANIIGKSRSHIANTLRLLNLPENVKTHLQCRRLTAGHARILLSTQNPEELAENIINNHLSVRDTETLVSCNKNKTLHRKITYKEKDIKNLELEKLILIKSGLKVTIKPSSEASGHITITYQTSQQFQKAIGILQNTYPE